MYDRRVHGSDGSDWVTKNDQLMRARYITTSHFLVALLNFCSFCSIIFILQLPTHSVDVCLLSQLDTFIVSVCTADNLPIRCLPSNGARVDI